VLGGTHISGLHSPNRSKGRSRYTGLIAKRRSLPGREEVRFPATKTPAFGTVPGGSGRPERSRSRDPPGAVSHRTGTAVPRPERLARERLRCHVPPGSAGAPDWPSSPLTRPG